MNSVFTHSEIVERLQTSFVIPFFQPNAGVHASWQGPTLTYRIDAEYDATQQAAARQAFELWDDLIDINLNQVTTSNESIYFERNMSLGSAVHHIDPALWVGGSLVAGLAGAGLGVGFLGAVATIAEILVAAGGNIDPIKDTKIWHDSAFAPIKTDDLDFDFNDQTRIDWASVHIGDNTGASGSVGAGQFGFETYVHEIGHALGLSHSGPYNGTAPPRDDPSVYAQDTNRFTIMSYFDETEDGSDTDWLGSRPSTPMLHDVLAIQAKYGIDPTTRANNTVYGFNSTANRDVFDFNINDRPVLTIYDAGGIDTLDTSGFDVAQTIDLRVNRVGQALADEKFSSIGGFVSNNGDVHRLVKNVAIAYDVIIENAKGGSGQDNITGNAAANQIYGNNGNDNLYGGAGNDKLFGGDGNEILAGGAGHDTLNGEGNDDELYGEGGNDQLTGGGGRDRLNGGADNDRMFGGTGDDRLFGYAGDDMQDGGDDNDRLFGGDGKDQMIGGAGNDTLDGENGSDTISGGTGNDVLRGGAANDTLRGGARDDIHDGGAGADYMEGGQGNDTYYVDHINDRVSDLVTTNGEPLPGALEGFPTQSNAGIDTVYADRASYTLSSFIENLQASRANPFAGTGNALDNTIRGHNAADTLKGLAGNDILIGRGGRDVLYGGKAPAEDPTPGFDVQVESSLDVFKFLSTTDTGTSASSRDLIMDFERGRDHIDLTAIDARTKSKANDAFSFVETDDFSGVAGQLRYEVTTVGRTKATIVEGDTNGDGIANFQIELVGRHALTASDFML